MRMLSKEDLFNLASHPEIKRFSHQGLGILRLSRDNSIFDPRVLFLFQLKIVENIILLEGKMNDVDKKSNDYFVIKYLIRCYKYFMDGIALRLMSFNANAHRILSENRDAGRLNKLGLKNEIDFLKEEVKKGNLAILNDLTNFIRLGDITIIKNGSIELKEIKSSKAEMSPKKKTLSSQQIKLRCAEEMINGNFCIIGEKRQKGYIFESTVNAKTFTNQVSDAISKANKNGFYSRKVSDLITIEATNFNVCVEKNVNLSGKRKSPEDFLTKEIFYFESCDLAYSKDNEFIRSAFPPTVHKMNTKNLTDYIFMQVFVTVFFDFGYFCSLLKESGFEVEINPEIKKVEINERYTKDAMPMEIRSEVNFITLKKNNFFLTIPSNFLSRVGFEFMDPRSEIDLCNYIYLNKTKALRGLQMQVFKNHRKLWL